MQSCPAKCTGLLLSSRLQVCVRLSVSVYFNHTFSEQVTGHSSAARWCNRHSCQWFHIIARLHMWCAKIYCYAPVKAARDFKLDFKILNNFTLQIFYANIRETSRIHDVFCWMKINLNWIQRQTKWMKQFGIPYRPQLLLHVMKCSYQ